MLVLGEDSAQDLGGTITGVTIMITAEVKYFISFTASGKDLC